MSLKNWLVFGFGLLPASLAWGQFFTPVSTILDAETWYTEPSGPGSYAQAMAQGPNDYQDLGAQIGSNTASSQLGYNGANYSTSTASTTADLTPSTFGGISGAGEIEVDQSATTNSGRPDYNSGYTSETIVFDLPQSSSLNISMDPEGHDQYASAWSLTGPNNTTYTNGNYASVPGGQYTLSSFASTEFLTGIGFSGEMDGYIRVLPEPAALALPAALLLLLRRRQTR